MKKLLAAILVCAMFFTLLPVTALSVSAAEAASGTSGDVVWSLSDDGILTFSGEGAMADYASTFSTPWKAYASQITKIVFESGVTRISAYAFQSSSTVQYSNLTEVVMNDVELIGTYAFRYDEALSSVSFGAKLTYIGPSAFSFCSSLDGVIFPETLKTIDHEAFNYCRALSEVVLSEGIETIEYSAFGNCTSLTDATLPDGISFIGTHIFNNCKNETVHGYTDSFAYMYCLLGSIPFDPIGTAAEPVVYASGTCGDTIWEFYSDGTLKITGEGAMEDYTSNNNNKVPWISYARQVTNVMIGEGVTHVGDYAFYNNSNTYYPKLQSVEVLGDASIGEAAFKYCKITEVDVVGEVTELEKDAFAFCELLTDFSFSGSLTRIGEAAFNGCKSLKSVTLPEGLISIGTSAFRSCSGLLEVTIPASVSEIATNAFPYSNPTFYGYDDSWFDMYCLLNNIVLNCLDKLEEPAVYDTGTTGDVTWTFYADGSLVIDGEGATADYTGTDAPWYPYRSQILSLEAGEGVTDIGTQAFAGCNKITEITFDGDAPEIASNGFTKVTADAYYKVSCDGWTEDVLINYGGKLTWIPVGCPHEYEAFVTEPTCTEDGYTTYTCARCEDSYVADYVDKYGHSYDAVVTEPTCTEDGYTTYICARCEDSYVADYVDKYGHSYDAVVTEPTCTENGYTTYTCARCEDSYVADYVDKYGHSYDAVVTEPTCTENGYTTYICARCEDSYVADYIDKYGHSYDAVVTEPTCTENGYTTYICARCEDSYVADYIDKYGHSYDEVITQPTCTEQGYTTFTCSRCSDSFIDNYVPALVHDYVAEIIPATCLDGGYTTYTCTRCSDSYAADETEAMGHSYEAVVTEPTCTEDGYTTYTCTRCSDSYAADETEAMGHSYEAVVTEPTCTEDGYTTYTCTRCSDSYAADETEAMGHSYEAVVTEPTCTEDGYTTYTCIRCSDSYAADETEALGHSFKEEVTEPTCTEPGYTDNVCTCCGERERLGTISPTGHHWYYDEEKRIEPTCTREGYDIYSCENCDAIYSEVIPMIACPTQDYPDVPGQSNWAHAGIDFCVTRGIMGSTSTSKLSFEPGVLCTRSMIVSILYRLSGEPDVTYESVFPDVPAGKWYSDAVLWAYHNGVVKGYDTGMFGPNDIITREQMAVILKGYTENILQQDTSASTTLDSFADCAKVKWSKDYVCWAVAVGMISGKTQSDGTVILDPQGKATRAEVASILMRFIQNLAEA